MTLRGLATVAFLGLLCASTLAQEQSSESRKERHQAVGQSSIPGLNLGDLSATRNRPLFAQDRRPPQPPAPPPSRVLPVAKATEPVKPKPVLSLRGIIVQPSSTLVLLQDMTTSESVVVRSGESFGPWRVDVEDDHSVKLAAGSEQVHLEMFVE